MTTALVRFVPEIGDRIQLRPDHPNFERHSPIWNGGRPSTWRVTGYMKAWQKPERRSTGFDAFIQDILDESCREFDHGKGRTRLTWCLKQEAQYVTGSGVSGCCWPVDAVISLGPVAWSQPELDHARISSYRNLGELLF